MAKHDPPLEKMFVAAKISNIDIYKQALDTKQVQHWYISNFEKVHQRIILYLHPKMSKMIPSITKKLIKDYKHFKLLHYIIY